MGVVHDMVGTDRGHQIRLGRTAYAGDLCAEGLGDLYGEGADATGCADDQHGRRPRGRLANAAGGVDVLRATGASCGDGEELQREVVRVAEGDPGSVVGV